ncbi:MAG: hypothetical protein VXW91_09470, partial [Pseudomonadota bacterium]|nr:hypothetical protein [Pseudomonadota bacterium]
MTTMSKAIEKRFPKAQEIAEFLSNTMNFKHRHLLTRDGRLRLRVVVPVSAAAFVGVFTLASFSMDSQAFQMGPDISEPRSLISGQAHDDMNMADLSNAREKRLERYENHEGKVEEVALFQPEPAKPREKSLVVGAGEDRQGGRQHAGGTPREQPHGAVISARTGEGHHDVVESISGDVARPDDLRAEVHGMRTDQRAGGAGEDGVDDDGKVRTGE